MFLSCKFNSKTDTVPNIEGEKTGKIITVWNDGRVDVEVMDQGEKHYLSFPEGSFNVIKKDNDTLKNIKLNISKSGEEYFAEILSSNDRSFGAKTQPKLMFRKNNTYGHTDPYSHNKYHILNSYGQQTNINGTMWELGTLIGESESLAPDTTKVAYLTSHENTINNILDTATTFFVAFDKQVVANIKGNMITFSPLGSISPNHSHFHPTPSPSTSVLNQ